MNERVYNDLKHKALEVAEIFSNPLRANNYNKEIFSLVSISVYSEHSAAVSYQKSSGLHVIAFFYFNNGRWFFFFPDDSVIHGMLLFSKDKLKVEQANALVRDYLGEKKDSKTNDSGSFSGC